FFSSRRRHTRLQGDWSSDVCSSDLFLLATGKGLAGKEDGGAGSIGQWKGTQIRAHQPHLFVLLGRCGNGFTRFGKAAHALPTTVGSSGLGGHAGRVIR